MRPDANSAPDANGRTVYNADLLTDPTERREMLGAIKLRQGERMDVDCSGDGDAGCELRIDAGLRRQQHGDEAPTYTS